MEIGAYIGRGPARLALLVVGLLVGLLLAGVVVFVLYDRSHSLAMARARTDAAANLLEEHARRTFAAVDTVLLQVKEQAGVDGLDALRDRARWSFLRRAAAHLPEEGQVFVVDATGLPVQSSVAFPPSKSPVVDWEFFQALKAGADEPHIGRTIRDQSAGSLIFTVSRRLQDTDGRFLGTVSAGIRTDYFTRLYGLLDLGTDAVYGIFRDDGAIVVRQPASSDDAQADILGTSLRQLVAQAGPGGAGHTSPLDGVDQILSFRRVGATGAFVAAGMPLDTALAQWRVRTAWLSAVTMAVMLVTAVLARLQLAGLRRQDETVIELDRLRRKAEAANLAKSRFLAAASHDLRQPIQALRLFLGILDGSLEKESHRQIAAHASQALDSSERLLTDLLDVTRLDAGAVRPDKRDLPLPRLLGPIVSEAAARAAEKGLEFRFHGLDEVVYSDPSLLERMVRNLVVNAIRYTERGRVVLACRRRGRTIRIEVWDTGPGIAADRLGLIWEEFEQAHTVEAGERGLGLGLSIVQRLGRMLDHGTHVHSRVGRGSVFAITVRCGRRDPARAHPPDPLEEEARAQV